VRLLKLNVECCGKLGRKFLCCFGDAIPWVFFNLDCNQIARLKHSLLLWPALLRLLGSSNAEVAHKKKQK
jgi:hypothetical protein